MAGGRRLRLLAALNDGGVEIDAQRLCRVGAQVTAMNGAGIMLMSGDIPTGSLGTTDRISALIEELQFTLGEGPCVDAYHHDRPIAEPDLAEPTLPRWPGFTPSALEAGARAVFGFPLRIGHIRLGALDLYRDRPGPLTNEQHADALELADIATHAVLVLQINAPAGEVAAELERGADFHLVVHQAAGMVAAQLEVSIAHSLMRLRAYAFAHDQPLNAVAEEVVALTLRFDDADDASSTTPPDPVDGHDPAGPA